MAFTGTSRNLSAAELRITGAYNGWNLEGRESIVLKQVVKGQLYISEEVTVPAGMLFKLSYDQLSGMIGFRSTKPDFEDNSGPSTNRSVAKQPWQYLWTDKAKRGKREALVKAIKEVPSSNERAWEAISDLLQDEVLRGERDIHRALLVQARSIPSTLDGCHVFVQLLVTLLSNDSMKINQESADFLQAWQPAVIEETARAQSTWGTVAIELNALVENLPPSLLNVHGLVARFLSGEEKEATRQLENLLETKTTTICKAIKGCCYIGSDYAKMLSLVVPTITTMDALGVWTDTLWPRSSVPNEAELKAVIESKLDELVEKDDMPMLTLVVERVEPSWYRTVLQSKYDAALARLATQGLTSETSEAVRVLRHLDFLILVNRRLQHVSPHVVRLCIRAQGPLLQAPNGLPPVLALMPGDQQGRLHVYRQPG